MAQSIFSHCGPDLLRQHLRDIFEALAPGGALLAKPGFDRSWFVGRALGWNTWLAHGPK